MAAWFALTEGRYHDVIDYAQAGQQHAGLTNAMIQLALQQARGQARLGERRDVHASLDHGARLLEQLPKPDHPENHFVFDHTKWIFYAATCYTWLGDDEPGRRACPRADRLPRTPRWLVQCPDAHRHVPHRP